MGTFSTTVLKSAKAKHRAETAASLLSGCLSAQGNTLQLVFWAAALATLCWNMFALEVAGKPVSAACQVERLLIPRQGKNGCQMWGITSAVVSTRALKWSESHPEVRKCVIRGNFFKYFNIFVDDLWHVELCTSCIRTFLHLSSLEKSHGVSISEADRPHDFFNMRFPGFAKSRSSTGGLQLRFFHFCSLAADQQAPL